MLHDDLYKYVKHDTLKGLNWVCGDDTYGVLGCNGGALPPSPRSGICVLYQIFCA